MLLRIFIRCIPDRGKEVADGTLCTRYTNIDVGTPYKAYPGGKVIFQHYSNVGRWFCHVGNTAYEIWTGTSCCLNVPANASGNAKLAISDARLQANDDDFDLSWSSGWVTDRKLYEPVR